jgi:DNA-directed RNA polymerase subunit N (RpoN/RPB10)
MPIASKYRRYLELVQQEDKQVGTISSEKDTGEVSTAQKAFQELGLTRYCCQRHMLSHIDLVDKL